MTFIDIPYGYYEDHKLLKFEIKNLEEQFRKGHLDVEGHARLNELRYLYKKIKFNEVA